jgi:predicted O-linked N-acetylglucosamine transferase (SPINDLY family)
MADVAGSVQRPIEAIWRKQVASFERNRQEQHREAIKEWQLQQEENPRNPESYIQPASHHQQLGEHKKALEIVERGLHVCAPSSRLYRFAVMALAESNRTKEAIQTAQMAAALFPEEALSFNLKAKLLLPVFYDTPEEITYYHDRFSTGITELLAELRLNTLHEKRRALNAISDHSNFYLAQQGRDVFKLRLQYSQYVSKIVFANFPEWVKPAQMPRIAPGEKIRVGYISPHFEQHSDSKCFAGWLRECNRDVFDVFAFHVGGKSDTVTDEIAHMSGHFFHVPAELSQICASIRNANLHISVLLDHDSPLMAQLAALRLAPIQCAAWGRPFTSASPAMNYFLSSALAEPDDAPQHYLEQLIRLPGIGICYYKPIIPRALLGLPRSAFGLREDRTVYLCCQSLFKYLPKQDAALVEIAKRNPDAQFAFLAPNDAIREDFRRRLGRAFADEKLDAVDHCVLIPRSLNSFDYWNLNLISDIYLDTFEFSGGVTTLEAIACGLPVVTLPGEFHRGRHSSAILRRLGVTETIAHSVEEYVEIAVGLGQDREWRAQILQRMSAGHGSLFGDTSSVRALEEFFLHVVREAGAQS